jgi:hypothetical protein
MYLRLLIELVDLNGKEPIVRSTRIHDFQSKGQMRETAYALREEYHNADKYHSHEEVGNTWKVYFNDGTMMRLTAL